MLSDGRNKETINYIENMIGIVQKNKIVKIEKLKYTRIYIIAFIVPLFPTSVTV